VSDRTDAYNPHTSTWRVFCFPAAEFRLSFFSLLSHRSPSNPVVGVIASLPALFRKPFIDFALIRISGVTLFQTKYNVRIIRI